VSVVSGNNRGGKRFVEGEPEQAIV